MSIEKQYLELLKDILENGVAKKDRTGTGTISVFGRQIRHKMNEGFPLLTTKKMYTKGVITELIWFLRGDTNIKYLVDNDCHIWDGDCYQAYLKNREKIQKEYKEKWGDEISNNPLTKEEFINKIKTDDEFAKKWGELGPIYGKQWRDLGGKDEVKLSEERDENGWLKYTTMHHDGVDQIKNLINDLKNNPDSRRLMVNAWNVDELDKMVLPPCHYGFQVYTRELSIEERLRLASKTYKNFDPFDFGIPGKVDHDEIDKMYPVPKRVISLMWNQRSVDTFLGLPFNIASYAFLLCIIAKEVNMVPDELVGNLGDVHLYSNHIDQAREQLTRETFDLPKIKLGDFSIIDGVDNIKVTDFIIEDYQSHATIKATLSN